MANLKDLKLRITSVKSTQKITKAMKMVAASKLRRAKERAEKATPYAERIMTMIESLAASFIGLDNAPKLIAGSGKEEVHLLIVIGSDRGLCGGLNTSLVKAAKRKIRSLLNKGKQVKLITVGKKSYELLKSQYDKNIIKNYDGLSKKKMIHYADAELLSLDVIKLFENLEFDVCTVFYNKFNSAISQEPTSKQLIPLDISSSSSKEEGTSSGSVYEYEPCEELILEELLPKNIAVQLFHGLLENAASEQGARMSAMDNATRNAGEMIGKLTLLYNRTRQAAITTELTEIVAGAEAL